SDPPRRCHYRRHDVRLARLCRRVCQGRPTYVREAKARRTPSESRPLFLSRWRRGGSSLRSVTHHGLGRHTTREGKSPPTWCATHREPAGKDRRSRRMSRVLAAALSAMLLLTSPLSAAPATAQSPAPSASGGVAGVCGVHDATEMTIGSDA